MQIIYIMVRIIYHVVSEFHEFLSFPVLSSIDPGSSVLPFSLFSPISVISNRQKGERRREREEIIAAFVWLPVAVIARAIAIGNKAVMQVDPVKGIYLNKHSVTLK